MYFLFAGDNYYPMGGMEDFVGAFRSIEQALSKVAEDGYEWYNIAKVEGGTLVEVDA